jgi:hypothetical protein
MSRQGNWWESAPTEGFSGRLKKVIVFSKKFTTP